MSDFLSLATQEAVDNSALLGTVVAVQANFYQVRLSQSITPCLLCTRRTRLKKIGQRVMVGDRVLIERADFQAGRGAIAQVLPRKTELERPPVANAQQILLVFALEEPSLDVWQLSRFLVKAESTSLAVVLCLNKTDLITNEQQEQWRERLIKWGYNPIFISVEKSQGLDKLIKYLQGKITILAGPSGVGKSSLINKLIPTVKQRVATVSGKLLKGRHTTRHVELFELGEGSFLADTPGFNQPDLDCHPNDLAWYFPEIRHFIAQGNCQFNNCLHRDEPNCIVQKNWERYDHYLKFLETAIARQGQMQEMGTEESTLKVKIKAEGQQQYEPKLESKKYRRNSRRKKHQSLHQKYENLRVSEIEKYEQED